jgi:dTDP-4-dehydrorhamnose 3,5-epimerase
VNFRALAVDGAFVLEPERHDDERGFFARTYSVDELVEQGLDPAISQISVSFNPRRGTLRGMHLQLPPNEETKIVRCPRGAMHDVIVDLRPESPTFGRHAVEQLGEQNQFSVYIPTGCAHGFVTLVDDTEVEYVISVPYAPESAAGVRWDDPAFGIEWPITPEVMSERDAAYPFVDLDALQASP